MHGGIYFLLLYNNGVWSLVKVMIPDLLTVKESFFFVLCKQSVTQRPISYRQISELFLPSELPSILLCTLKMPSPRSPGAIEMPKSVGMPRALAFVIPRPDRMLVLGSSWRAGTSSYSGHTPGPTSVLGTQ